VEGNVTEEIAKLSGLNKAQLLPVWRRHYNQEPPPNLRKELMVPLLAYRMQEKQFGGLSHWARKRLREIAQSLGKEKRSHPDLAPSLRAGTRLIRRWGGEVHEVSVTEAGFAYRGKGYKSLSQIAREITGTRWSGPLFFGTKKQAGKGGR
jgi:hypothetical protein